MIEPVLPPDDHVHTEWSWDAAAGSMERSCARAVQLGLPSIAFTDHVDATRWVLTAQAQTAFPPERVGADGRFDPPPIDVEGYLVCVDRCRRRYPDLRILTGVELGEPHWFERRCKALLGDSGGFDRVLGSLHNIAIGDEPWPVDHLFLPGGPHELAPARIVRAYLAETLRMVESSDVFQVLAHIDYPVRAWPDAARTFDPADFEDEYRAVLRALAGSGRALEVNTRLPLRHEIVRWWYEAGGEAVSFGSDAHVPDLVAHGFEHAATMVETQGFHPGRHPHDFWRRRPPSGAGH